MRILLEWPNLGTTCNSTKLHSCSFSSTILTYDSDGIILVTKLMLPLLTFASSPVLPVFVFLPKKMLLKRSNLVLQNSVLILKNRTAAALAFGPGWFIISW